MDYDADMALGFHRIPASIAFVAVPVLVATYYFIRKYGWRRGLGYCVVLALIGVALALASKYLDETQTYLLAAVILIVGGAARFFWSSMVCDMNRDQEHENDAD